MKGIPVISSIDLSFYHVRNFGCEIAQHLEDSTMTASSYLMFINDEGKRRKVQISVSLCVNIAGSLTVNKIPTIPSITMTRLSFNISG